MQRHWLAIVACLALVTQVAADQHLEEKPLHQAKSGPPILELVTWDCDWQGGVTVSIVGQVKNISATPINNAGPYIQVRDQSGHVIGDRTGDTFDIPELEPNARSHFHARIRMQNAADVPAECDLDFIDVNGDFVAWR